MTETLAPPAVAAAGWYDDPESFLPAKRWWNGSEWGALTPEDRQAALAGRVAYWVGLGWRVESQSPEQAVLGKGHRPNHILHLILTILTLGLWLIVWIIVSATGGEKRKTVSVDPNGRPVES